MSPRHLMRVLVLPKSLVERRALIVPAAGCLLVLRKQHVVSATRLADALLGLTEHEAYIFVTKADEQPSLHKKPVVRPARSATIPDRCTSSPRRDAPR